MITCLHVFAWFPRKPGQEAGFPGIGVTGSDEPPCVCWESNRGPLKEEPVLSTTKPSLRSPDEDFV